MKKLKAPTEKKDGIDVWGVGAGGGGGRGEGGVGCGSFGLEHRRFASSKKTQGRGSSSISCTSLSVLPSIKKRGEQDGKKLRNEEEEKTREKKV